MVVSCQDCDIWGFHVCVAEDSSVSDCDAVLFILKMIAVHSIETSGNTHNEATLPGSLESSSYKQRCKPQLRT
jgi:hypothetical protein